MEKSSRGVRKGTWTKEEDTLLRRCIEKYGEGKWHQVPLRAGLNRCRKSCRLRWLNYLRPSIKRGCFTEDELDLIVRLHKLLGNKWSLIAGRLPGRTANDVKNFWNTHVEKKLSLGQQTRSNSHIRSIDVQNTKTPVPTLSSNIVRPRPRTFTNLLHATRKTNECNDDNKQIQCSDEGSGSSSQERADDCVEWWNKLLELTENGEIVKGPLEDTLVGEASLSGLGGGGGTTTFSFEEFDWGLLNIGEEL